MSQNFTIDDTDSTLFWGPGWGVESSNDPALDRYFESTYHASTTSGANVSLFFSGIGIYLFGSKGPNHGNFSVRYDNFIQLLSAKADKQSYRQLLFSNNFLAGNHSITLTNTDNNQSWLDLDFVTVTGPGNVPVPSDFSSTISPPSVSPTATQGPITSPLSTAVQSPSPSNSNITPLTLILAAVFGSLLFFLAGGIAWFLICRAHRRRGTPYQRPDGTDPSLKSETRSPGSAFRSPQPTITPFTSHLETVGISPLGTPGTSYNSTTNNIALMRQSEGKMQQQDRVNSAPRPITPARPHPARPWSPFSVPIGRIFGTTKDGADSMKSTFLKV